MSDGQRRLLPPCSDPGSERAAGPDLIQLPAGTYTLTIPTGVPGPNNVDPAHGDLDIADALVIQGDGAAVTVVAGTSTATAVGRAIDVGRDVARRRADPADVDERLQPNAVCELNKNATATNSERPGRR